MLSSSTRRILAPSAWVTVVASTMKDVVAPSANRNRFVGWLKRKLLPKLRRGDVLVMDNLAAHHDARVVPVCTARGGRVLYQPRYSPDLNPIESGWALQKQHVRKHAPRTAEALRRIARRARYRVTCRHCRNWFKHCGYPGPLRSRGIGNRSPSTERCTRGARRRGHAVRSGSGEEQPSGARHDGSFHDQSTIPTRIVQAGRPSPRTLDMQSTLQEVVASASPSNSSRRRRSFSGASAIALLAACADTAEVEWLRR
jgi:transposase